MGVCVAKNEGKKNNKKEHGHEHKNHDSGKTKQMIPQKTSLVEISRGCLC